MDFILILNVTIKNKQDWIQMFLLIYCEEQVGPEIAVSSFSVCYLRMPVTRRQKWKRYSGKWLKKWKRLKKEKLKLIMSWKKYRYIKTLAGNCRWLATNRNDVFFSSLSLYCSLWWMKQNMLLGTSSLKLCLRSAPFACPLMSSETFWREF